MGHQDLYQHFNADEQEFVDKVLDLVDRLDKQYVVQLTDFLDPRQQAIAKSVLGQAGVAYYSSKDSYDLEYARFLLAPDYYVFDADDFDMTLVEISYQAKFSQLSHSQILGSLVKGLGLKRQVIGDILVAKGRAQVVLASPLVDYLLIHTEKMARTGVRLKALPFEQLLTAEEETESRLLLLSSLRLDKVVAGVTKLSRSQAQELIAKGRVKVNYREITKPELVLELGDLVSCRGYGRFRLAEHLGQTKTDKHKLMIEETLKR